MAVGQVDCPLYPHPPLRPSNASVPPAARQGLDQVLDRFDLWMGLGLALDGLQQVDHVRQNPRASQHLRLLAIDVYSAALTHQPDNLNAMFQMARAHVLRAPNVTGAARHRQLREASRWLVRLTRAYRRVSLALEAGVVWPKDPLNFQGARLWGWPTEYKPLDDFEHTTSWKLEHDVAQMRGLMARGILREAVFGPVVKEMEKARKVWPVPCLFSLPPAPPPRPGDMEAADLSRTQQGISQAFWQPRGLIPAGRRCSGAQCGWGVP